IQDVADTSFRWLQIQSRIEEGTCRWLGGDLGGAQRDYAAALAQSESAGYRNLSLRALNHLSSANSAAGDLALSVAQTRDGLQRYWSAYVPVIQGYNLYFSLHEVAELSREPYLDVVVWRESVALIDHRADIVLCAMAHSYYGDAAMSAGEPELTKQEFERSSADFAAAPPSSATRMHLIEAETRIAGAESQLGKSDEAAARLQRYQQEIGVVSDDFLALLYYRTRGDLNFRRGSSEIAERDLLQATGFAEANLRSLKDESSRRRWSEENGTLYRELVELQLRQGQPNQALETWEWYRAAELRTSGESVQGSTSSAEDHAVPSLHYVADQLSTLTDTTVLAYTVFSDGVAIWVYDDRGIREYWSAEPGAEISEMAQRFQGLCADPSSSLESLRQQGGSLYQAIVAPVEHELEPGRTILIDADGELASVPFEALVDGKQKYFGESHALAWTPGLYYLAQLRSVRSISSDTPLLVAAVESSHASIAADLPPLPDAAREANLVAGQFRAVTLKQDARANLAEISAALPSAGVFHFAGHALTIGSGSALVLWDSVMNAGSLAPASLARLQLAVFSACETERGGQPGGEDAESLVRIFSRAGVPHVVASRWRVDSTASAAFMYKFYNALLAGNSVTHALQAAETSLRNSPEMSHPYYWAPFHEFGRN
ncbi:MAG: CHAT domain-containing protein, partial [Acidobacteriales bacterium]|nr:CHAT domain-containing protein [Terriglobales bacterium]